MRCSYQTIASWIVATLVVAQPLLTAKPSGPVHISASPSTLTMQTGDVVESTIELLALADLTRLEVSLSVIEGIEIVSGPTAVVFENVKKGEKHQVVVSIKLTAPRYGDLAVQYEAVMPNNSIRGAIGVTYGNPKN